MSSFTAATIHDMSDFDEQQEYWVSNFVQNSMLRTNVNAPFRQYMFNFLRRAEAAFREYTLAREATYAFLGSMGSASRYMAALFHWEVWLSQAWHGYELLRRVAGGVQIFEKGDGSIEQRLNLLYNQAKHVASEIENGNLPTSDATLGVWLENAGLRSNDGHLTFSESALVLEDLARWADRFQDPATLGDKLRGVSG